MRADRAMAGLVSLLEEAPARRWAEDNTCRLVACIVSEMSGMKDEEEYRKKNQEMN